jgi:hypothetical protein
VIQYSVIIDYITSQQTHSESKQRHSNNQIDAKREPELVEISTRRWFQYKRFVVPLICSIILLCLYVYVNSLPEMQTAANLELDALVGAALTNSSASPLVQSGEVAEADNILSPKDSLIIDNIVA